jgi:predicted MFS family arabinose efflux permease
VPPSRTYEIDEPSASARCETSANVRTPRVGPWLLYSGRQRAAFLAILFLVGASNNIDRNILGVLLPQIKSEFLVSDTRLGLLSGITFACFYATLGVPLARWADRGDRKRILSFSLIVWSAMTMSCGLALSFWQLALARIGVGAGEAGAIPPAQSLIADYFPPEGRAGAMGVFMMSSALGYGFALILGGYVAQHFGWRSAFMLVGVAGLLLGPMCLLVLKEPRANFASEGAAEPYHVALVAMFKAPAYRCILSAIVIYFFAGYGALVFIVSLIMRLFGISVQTAGATFGIISMVAGIVGNLLGGFGANHLAKRSLANLPRTAGWAMIACVPLFELALSRSTMAAMKVPLFLAMLVLNVMVAPLYASLHLTCASNRRATAVAIVLLFANLVGLGLGPFLTGLISDYLEVVHGPAEALRSSLMALFLVVFVGGAFMLRSARYIANANDHG